MATSRPDSLTKSNQPVYVLHTYAFKETSLVAELFTRDFGRVAAVAKGARRPRSAMRGMMQSFQPLLGTWSGKLELKNLHSLEWGSGLLLLQGDALMCGFYLNELLLRLLPREDAHESLFDYYALTLRTLSSASSSTTQHASTLRRFELKLLQEMGYAVPLQQDELQADIVAERAYFYLAELGATQLGTAQAAPSSTGRPGSIKQPATSGVQLSGKTLLDMANDDYSDVQTQQQSKQLMRSLLAHYLGDKPLHTRQLLMDLQEL